MAYLPLQKPLIWHSLLLLVICGLLAAAWLLPATFAAALLLFFDRRLWSWQRLCLAFLIFASALAYAHISLKEGYVATASLPPWKKGARVCGEIHEVRGMPGNRLVVTLGDVSPQGEAPLPGYCAWTWEEPARQPLKGERVCLARQVKPVSSFANSAEDGFPIYQFSKSIFWRMWSRGSSGDPEFSGDPDFFALERERLRRAFLGLLRRNSPDGNALSQPDAILLALLFGDRQFLAHDTAEAFATATIAHSLALSGQHLVIAGLLGSILITFAAFFRPAFYLIRPRLILCLAVAVPVAVLYLWLGNCPASLQRAAAMLCIAALCLCIARPCSGQDLLCGALALILLVNPLAVFDIGLQMSALCVAVIVLVWASLSRNLPAAVNKAGNWRQQIRAWLLQILAISLCIQIALLPLSLIRFQQAGLLFAFNILWLPFLAFIVLPGAVSALILLLVPGCEQIALLAVNIAGLPCSGLLGLLGMMKEHGLLAEPSFLLPHWTSLLAYALIAAGLVWIAGMPENIRNARKGAALLATALILLCAGPCQRLFASLAQQTTIEALDTGQSQAVLVTLPDNIRILIDGGGSYSANFDPGKRVVAPILAANRPPKVQAVINSHPDQDHLGGLFHIIENFSPEVVFHNGRPAPGGNRNRWQEIQSRGNAHTLVAGDRIILGDPKERMWLEVAHPAGEQEQLTGNAASLILRLVHDGRGLCLFTGDAEKSSLAALAASNGDLGSDVIFAPHHGSDKNLSGRLYSALSPSAVVACCGYLNRWSYPGAKLRGYLEARGIPLFDTGTNGRVSVTFRNHEPPEFSCMVSRSIARQPCN